MSAPRSSRRLPVAEKLALAMGAVASQGAHNAIHTLVSQVYTIWYGLSPTSVSLAVFLQRIWDALLDPLIGHYSDGFKSRWGRRRPLMLVSALPMAATFWLIWFVPASGTQAELFMWLLLSSLAFYFFYSVYSMPLAGLTLEVTDDYHERTSIGSYCLVAGFLVAVAVNWILPLAQVDLFADRRDGLIWTTGLLAAVFFVAGMVAVARTRENPRASRVREPLRLGQSLVALGRNRTFLILVVMRSVSTLGFALVAVIGPYLNYYLVYKGDLRAGAYMMGVLGTSYLVTAIVAVGVFNALARRKGKIAAFRWAAAMLVVGGALKLVVYDPAWPYLQMFVYITNGAALSGLALITSSMLGDVALCDQAETGLRREGTFAALFAWADKVGNSIGVLVSGMLVVWLGFDAKLGGGQPPEVLKNLQLVYALFPLLGSVVAIVASCSYGLGEAAVARARERINAADGHG